MEPTIRISIGTVAFTFEQKAYRVLQDYFEALKEQLGDSEATSEIIKDVEYRLSELFQIRLENKSNIVNLDDVLAVLKIMGNPKDFGSDNEDESSTDEIKERISKQGRNKRIYRDKSNGIIGGVCSGLSHYFRVDVIIFRLLFVVPFVLLFFNLNYFFEFMDINILSPLWIMIIYVILWIIIPRAKSFEQKVAMTGGNLTIIDDSYSEKKKYRGSIVRSVFMGIYKFILIVLMIITILWGISSLCAFIWMCFDQSFLYVDNYISFLGLNSIQIKATAFVLLFIPVLGIFTLTYKLLRRTPFKKDNLWIFLLGLTFWIGSGVYAGYLAVHYLSQTNSNAEECDNIALKDGIETLYISLGEEYNNAKIQPNMPLLLYKKRDNKENDVCLVLNVNIVEDENIDYFQVEIVKEAGDVNNVSAQVKARNVKLDYVVQDSLLTLYPEWHNTQNPWSMTSVRLKVKVPRNKQAKLVGYLEDVRRW